MPSWMDHPQSPDEASDDGGDRPVARPGNPSRPSGSASPDGAIPELVAEGNGYGDGRQEFHGSGPVPEGFGFRTGMRSARSVLGFAWLVLIMGTLLLLMGAVIFIGQSAWIPVILLCVLELGFIAVFVVLRNLARQRRNQHD